MLVEQMPFLSLCATAKQQKQQQITLAQVDEYTNNLLISDLRQSLQTEIPSINLSINGTRRSSVSVESTIFEEVQGQSRNMHTIRKFVCACERGFCFQTTKQIK